MFFLGEPNPVFGLCVSVAFLIMAVIAIMIIKSKREAVSNKFLAVIGLLVFGILGFALLVYCIQWLATGEKPGWSF